MTEKKLYLIIQSVLCVLMVILLIASAISIYCEGRALRAEDPMASIYTREKVVEKLRPISPLFFAAVGLTIAGWLLAGKTGGASTSMGMGYELEAIAACTIGGVSTTGGIGTVSGVLVGVLVFELLKIVLQFLGVNPYYNYIVQGIVIVVAVALDVRKYLAKK